jgi:hypothetical protein
MCISSCLKWRVPAPAVRVGVQLQPNKDGVGVLGIMEADFLQVRALRPAPRMMMVVLLMSPEENTIA